MAKKTIMLVCSAGMSTSLLVTKMQKAAEEKGLTFREVLYLPEMIDARIKKEIEKREEPFRRTPQQ